VPCYEDIRDLAASRLRDDGVSVDAICGGFPCQDISTAGKGAGIEGERSGLWSEYARLIGELRPQVVFVENVSALLSRGLDKVLGDLAALGYDAEWHCIPASAIGAPHRRDRVWIVAYPSSARCGLEEYRSGGQGWEPSDTRQPEVLQQRNGTTCSEGADAGCQDVANTPGERVEGDGPIRFEVSQPPFSEGLSRCYRTGSRATEWQAEPNVGRVADGVSPRLDRHRLAGLGNAVVPQIPELLGNAYLESIGWRAAA
jgi:DNA (cytosine-5)-methyltransferase 1